MGAVDNFSIAADEPVADSFLRREVEGCDDGVCLPGCVVEVEELVVAAVHVPLSVPYTDIHLHTHTHTHS